MCYMLKDEYISCLHFKTQILLHKTFCGVVMPSEDTNILGFNQYWKSDKTRTIIYAGIESM